MSEEFPEPELGMSRERFWQIIDASRQPTPANLDAHRAALRKQLVVLSRDELIAFADAYNYIRDEASHWDLWAAGYILNHRNCSNDGFDYFKDWVISQGHDVFTAALADAQSLIHVVQPDTQEYEAELFAYVAGEVFEEKFGEPMPDLPCYAFTFEGEEWDEATVHEKFPKLAAFAKTRES